MTMGLKDRLNAGGTVYSNGATSTQSPENVNARLKNIHFTYSVNGVPNIEPPYEGFPQPSKLDLNGITPLGPNRDGLTSPINNTFSQGTYKNSAPDSGVGRI
jgi:hypothetical protein